MDLKGAEIRNLLEMCMDMNKRSAVPLKVNIPYYQRPYRWDEEKINNLINDYHENSTNNSSEEYFAGSVVLVKNKSKKRYDIIDGQQRVTTMFLLNFLRFIIQRSLIEELIMNKDLNLTGELESLEYFYSQLLGKENTKQLQTLKNTINKKMSSINLNQDYEKIKKVFDDILVKYRDTVGLPEKYLSNKDKYFKNYVSLNKNFYKNDELGLTYDRKTFNEALKEALSKTCVLVSKDKDIELNIVDTSGKQDANVKQFTDAIKYEFNSLKCKPDLKDDPIDNTRSFISYITDIINNIKFCVIITGNENDAYTLFEVLNDRAMEINDLELIKNLFLKTYCVESGDSDNVIDSNIGILDEVWGDEIFTRDMSRNTAKKVSYLGTVYLTADENVILNKAEKYREVLQEKHLKQYLKRSNPYSFTQVKNDIRVFHMVKLIIEEFELNQKSTNPACIAAECNSKVSITYKAFHLLNALNQIGVIAALSNMVIKKFEEEMQKKAIEEICPDAFKKFLKDVKEDCNHSKYSDIHELAFKLWKAALFCKDAKLPREFARKAIKNIYRDSLNIQNTTLDFSPMLDEFRNWLEDWKYGSADDLKLKVLFINLFKAELDHKKNVFLFNNVTVHTFITDKLQLDHMEAANPNTSNIAKHFTPKDPNQDRNIYTDRLGNFMILDSDNNNNKDNKPLAEAMDYYENMSHNHWLNNMTKDLLKKYHNKVDINGNAFQVPNEQFFNKRKSKLIEYFEIIINRDLNAKEASLQ